MLTYSERQELKQKQEIKKLREEGKPKTRHLQAAASRDTKFFVDRTQSELEVLSPRATRVSLLTFLNERIAHCPPLALPGVRIHK